MVAGPILVVDDDLDIRELLVELLEDHGFRACSAGHGQEALDWLASNSETPCLMLLDLMMPIMNGWELAQKLQENSNFASIPIVLISADRDVTIHAQALQAAGCLQKPVELKALLEVAHRYC